MDSTDQLIAKLPYKPQEERDRHRANAEKRLETGTPDQKAQAHRVMEALDALGDFEAPSSYDRIADMSLKQRVIACFTAKPETEWEVDFILALLARPGATAVELSEYMGLGKSPLWGHYFGKMCEERQWALLPEQRKDGGGTNAQCSILAINDQNTSGWTMKPDVAEAFAELWLLTDKVES